MLRDHGPPDAGLLLTMMMLSTWMDGDGYAFPAQRALATAARCSTRTVQRHIAAAETLGWLAVTPIHRGGGHGWRRNEYRACIPGHIDLADLDESLRDDLLKACDDVDGRGDTIMSSPSTPCGNVTTPEANVATPVTERDDTRRHNVTTQLWRNNSSMNSSKNSSTEGPALRAAPDGKKPIKKKKTNGLAHVSDVLPGEAAANRVQQECKAGPVRKPRLQRKASPADVLKLNGTSMTPERIALTLGLPLADVQSILESSTTGEVQ